MNKKYCYIDFEYNGTNQEKLNLVSVSYSLSTKNKNHTHWLFNDQENKDILIKEINELIKQDFIFVAWNVLAEASAFYSLGINPISLKWYDLYLEYRMVTNHCHKLQYGKQLIDGIEKFTKPPLGFYDNKDDESHQKPQHNLASGTYKLLGKIINTERKDRIRDLIISSPIEFSDSERKEILEYNESDIELLPELLEAFRKIWSTLIPKSQQHLLQKEILLRGEYASRSAVIERIGYPIDLEACTNFFHNSQLILNDIMKEINELFPEIAPFEWNPKTKKYSRKEKKIFEWIESDSDLKSKWDKTPTKKYKLDMDTVTKFFNYSHNYPKNIFGAQLVRLLKTKQSMSGFIPPSADAKNKETFFHSVGIDNRARAFMGIYGGMTARSQARSTSFIPLKSAWFRALITPIKGKAIAGLDYSSQEFLISALFYSDKNMIESYRSGDVYFAFAKLAKAVKPDALRKDNEEIRDLFKATVLGLSYQMSKIGLARKLTLDTGKKVTEDMAQEMINKFDIAYPQMYQGRKDLEYKYFNNKHLKLPCGWYLFGDNKNSRSTNNFPIQGMGSSILRKAVALAQDAGLTVIYTLHDAIYIEYDSGDFGVIDTLERCMREAFIFYYLGTDMEKYANLIRMDGKTWSPDYVGANKLKTPNGMEVDAQTIYVDKRSKSEYEQFKKYLTERF